MELKASKAFIVNTIKDGEPGAPGQPGAAGKNGKWYDFAGEWGTGEGQISSVTNTANIGYYVKYGNSFYMNIAPDRVANTTTPGTSGSMWEEMQADRQYYIAKAFFGEYAHFGSGIINGDWMISTKGTINGTVSEDFEKFDPTHPNEDTGTNFIPKYALDLLNGTAYMNDAELKGKITANSGQLGGWYISDQNIFISSDDMRTAAFLTIGKSEEEGAITYYPQLSFSQQGAGYSRRDTNISLGGFSIKHLTGMTTTTINEINADGSGLFGRGNFAWDTAGNITIKGNSTDSVLKIQDGEFILYSVEEEAETGHLQLNYDGVKAHAYGSSNSELTGRGVKVDGGYIDVLGGSIFLKESSDSTYLGVALTSQDICIYSPEDESSVVYLNNEGKVEANSFVKSGGTSSQVLMADGSTKTGYNGSVNLGNYTLFIEGGIITEVLPNAV